MSSERERLAQRMREIVPVDEREVESILRTQELLDQRGESFFDESHDHHVTASAFVISSRGVILHRHRRLGIWVQPGGHVDPGETSEGAALREVSEETGLVVRHWEPPLLFHVDVHPGPRGHTHYDVRYVVIAPPDEPVPPPNESPDVFWFDSSRALERCEVALAPALRKLFASSVFAEVRD